MGVGERRVNENLRSRRLAPEMDQEATNQQQSQAVWLLAALVVLAAVLRFWRLGDWSFQATEMFTLRDSDTPQFSNPRPLGYLLNYYLIRPLLPLDEFGLRLLPAVFGVLAIPIFYTITRRLIDTRTALFGALLVAVSPLLVMYSQLARYWSLVFLLSAIYPYAIYLGIRERSPGALAVGLVAGILAVLAHPVSIVLIGGPLVWLLVTYARPRHLVELWNRKSFRWGLLAACVVAAIVAVRFIPMLQAWITAHDEQKSGGGQFLLRTPLAPGLKQLLYVLAYAESLTVPVALGAIAGIYMLWRERDRTLALFLASLAVFHVAFLALISLRTAVSQYYLLPATPVFYIGAGVFLARVASIDWKSRPRWLVPAVVVTIFIAAGAPTVLSDLRDGRRYDYKGMARWLGERLGPDDVVFSDQFMVMKHYLEGTNVQRLRSPAPLQATLEELRQGGQGGVLWVIAPAPSHPFRTTLKRGGLISWVLDNCQLRYTRGVGRVDLRQQYLQAYRCPSAPPPANRVEGQTRVSVQRSNAFTSFESWGSNVTPFRASTSW
jgi:mannosyltransferase